jgi:hypothetical protein
MCVPVGQGEEKKETMNIIVILQIMQKDLQIVRSRARNHSVSKEEDEKDQSNQV